MNVNTCKFGELGQLGRWGLVWLLGSWLGLTTAFVRADVEAVAGRPFGVARVTVPFPPEDVGGLLGAAVYAVDDPAGRVLYPAFNQGLVTRLLGASAPPPATLTVLFLFRGSELFDVTIRTPSPQRVHIAPSVPGRAHARLLRQWWRYYSAAARFQGNEGDYPPLVEAYLTSMLARRLGLAPPVLDRLQQANRETSLTQETFQLLLGTEQLRLDTLRALSAEGPPARQPADRPVPADIVWRRPAPNVPDPVPVEPLAMHVPEECFYVRFGQFTNYLWLNRLLEDYGGDISSMMSARSLQLNLNERVQRQLGLKQSALAEVLGPAVIADVALLGRDMFVREGAAIGILFEARNSLLGADLARQRNEALAREQDNGATRETIRIAGQDVSFYSTPDNRLRSYYAIDGDYHLVTTSRVMVERFYAAGRGERALGASAEFRSARALLPIDRDDTVFVFLSTSLLQGLLSPQYQVELARRMRAVTEIELIKLARLAAGAEQVEAGSVPELIAAGLLPNGIGQRPDGSGPILTGNDIEDSLRGGLGTFTPIPDIPLRGVTAGEQAWYQDRARYYAGQWQQLDPLMIAVQRQSLATERGERLTIDAYVSPLDEAKYGLILSMLGPPTNQRVVRPPGQIATVEFAVRGGLLFPGVPPHVMFLGIEDHAPLADWEPQNVLKVMQILRSTPGYLGAWPKPGFLDLLPLNLGGTQADAQGFSQLLFGFWRWQGRGFSLVSQDQAMLARAAGRLGFVPAEDPAQIRIHVGNLAQAKFADWLTAMTYERARQTSVGNARLLNLLTQQLAVPREQAREVARDLLEADLRCPLGGDYKLVDFSTTPVWQSSAWPDRLRYTVPAEYTAPLLAWFRGLEANLIKQPDRLVVRAHLDMERKESATPPPGSGLLELFGGQKNSDPQPKD